MTQLSTWANLPEVGDLDTLTAYDGTLVRLRGRYEAIPMPSKRRRSGPMRNAYSQIVLRDETAVLIGTYNTSEALRDPAEVKQYDGRQVCLIGEVHRVMPSVGQAPRMPAVRDVKAVFEIEDQEKPNSA